MSDAADARRTKELGIIHMAKAQLGLDDATYRDMLWTVARVRSAAALDSYGRARVIEHLRARGFAKAHKGRPAMDGRNRRQLRKIEAYLAEASRPWAYVHAMARRMYDVARVEWCTPRQLQGIIAALERDAKRQGRYTGG